MSLLPGTGSWLLLRRGCSPGAASPPLPGKPLLQLPVDLHKT